MFPSLTTVSSIVFVKLKSKTLNGWLKASQGYSHKGWASTKLSEMDLELWIKKTEGRQVIAIT
jgi:hypothetical protein